MVVFNDLERFQLVQDVIKRLLGFGEKGEQLLAWARKKIIEHKEYIEINGQDLPEIQN